MVNYNSKISLISSIKKFELSPPKVINGHIFLEVYSAYQGLQNTGFRQFTGIYDSNSKTTTITRDYFIFRTNSFNFGLDVNFFDEYAPVGRYFKLGAGFSHAQSTIYPTFEVEVEKKSINLSEITTEKGEPGFSRTTASYFSIGFGRTRLISRKILVDYGFKTSLYWSLMNPNSNFGYLDGKNYKFYFEKIVDHIVTGNLQSSNAIEIFIKIGFTK